MQAMLTFGEYPESGLAQCSLLSHMCGAVLRAFYSAARYSQQLFKHSYGRINRTCAKVSTDQSYPEVLFLIIIAEGHIL